MEDSRIRKLQEWVEACLRSQAKKHGRTLGEEVRETLTEAALPRKKEIADELREDLYELEGKHGLLSGSAKLIREMRDARC